VKIAVIFSTIVVPIFVSIILSLTFLIIGLKIKIKNNNFWDAIANCEIISNYYIH
jgi:pilus assembly protein TadC